jgi:chromosome segregation ATPase
MSLASINSQIRNTQQSINSLHTQVGLKQDEIDRLNRAITEIEGLQGDYEESRRHWQDVQLSASTWRGELADKFEAFRDGELAASFRDVSETEVERVLDELQQAKSLLVAEVDNCQMQIAYKQSSLDRLHADKKQEMRNE